MNVNPYLVETASKLERAVGKFIGESNILIFLICLKLKSCWKTIKNISTQMLKNI